ncbi:hypothetical protein BESB_055130 [Besnoitia besnoiti]|uniref:Uncharacterized protein n=1 Tax=Besnoitia besnoiti TaxID=94643 RepID=A0A2A9MKC3_BESBE|nr:hypothetical protein BESB_055130 [Besnoitia besnoiti]PFH35862.1 hypothetical protein BESB_055130 [Besnoitia besnoiti]
MGNEQSSPENTDTPAHGQVETEGTPGGAPVSQTPTSAHEGRKEPGGTENKDEGGIGKPGDNTENAPAEAEKKKEKESGQPEAQLQPGYSRYLSGLGNFFTTEGTEGVSASSEVVNNIASYMSLEAVKGAFTGENDSDETETTPHGTEETTTAGTLVTDAKETDTANQESDGPALTTYLTQGLQGVSDLFRSVTQDITTVATDGAEPAAEEAPIQSTGSKTLGESAPEEAPIQSTGSKTLGESAPEEAPIQSTGSKTLGESAPEEAPIQSTGSKTLGESAPEEAPIQSTGSKTLGESAPEEAPIQSTGSKTLGESAPEEAPIQSTGSKTLGKSASKKTEAALQSHGSKTLDGVDDLLRKGSFSSRDAAPVVEKPAAASQEVAGEAAATGATPLVRAASSGDSGASSSSTPVA